METSEKMRQDADAARKKILEMSGNPGDASLNPNIDTAPEKNPEDVSDDKEIDPAPAELNPEEEPETVTPPAEPEPEEKPVEPEKKSDYWKNRFKVMEGKYNSELPALRAQINTMVSQVNLLQSENINLKQQIDQQKTQLEEPRKTSKIDPESFRVHGDEFVGMAEILNTVANSVGNIDGLSRKVEQVTQAFNEGQQKFHEDRQKSYDERIFSDPLVQKYNQDTEFLAWLNGVNPYTGLTRGASLSQAHEAMDEQRVKLIFQEYANTQANLTPKQNPPPPPPPKPQNGLSISPAGGAADPSLNPNNQGKPTFTAAAVQKFWDDRKAGRLDHKGQAWITAKTAEIMEAYRDRRVVGA